MIENRNVEVEERHVEKKSDSSLVAATFIKYAAYIIIFFRRVVLSGAIRFPDVLTGSAAQASTEVKKIVERFNGI